MTDTQPTVAAEPVLSGPAGGQEAPNTHTPALGDTPEILSPQQAVSRVCLDCHHSADQHGKDGCLEGWQYSPDGIAMEIGCCCVITGWAR